jgi:meiotic recombination protein DMC1
LLSAFGVDPDTALGNILCARALNSEHQHELLNTLAREFAGGDFVLLVVDSIMACFSVDYQGRGELSHRQGKLNQFLSKLSHMAEEFNTAVLMVCHLRWPLGTSPMLTEKR